MSRVAEYAGHILRTMGLVVGLAGGGALAFLLLPFAVAGVLVVVAVGLVIYFTARLQAHWTPVSDRVVGFAWEDAAGVPHETVVEMARLESPVYAGLSKVTSLILRVSIYRVQGTRRRVQRVLVGDTAEWLGRHGDRLWFMVGDRYHSGRKGLVAHDVETLRVSVYHPGREVQPEQPRRGRRKKRTTDETGRTVLLETREGRVAVKLESGEVTPVGAVAPEVA